MKKMILLICLVLCFACNIEVYAFSSKFYYKYNNHLIEYRNKFNNSDIIGRIVIDNMLDEAVVKNEDNEYYLKHDINNKESIYGATFLDYRVNLNSSDKIIIYSHNSKNLNMPFSVLEEYKDFNYYKNHKYITIETDNYKDTYVIFSVYVETSDWYYTKLNTTNSDIDKLIDRSYYKTNINVSSNDKILILQTCSEDSTYKSFDKKFLIVSAKKIAL